MDQYSALLKQLIKEAAAAGATDLHLSPGHNAIMRVDTRLLPIEKSGILDHQATAAMAFELLGSERKDKFLKEKEADFSFLIGEDYRFRVNVYYTRGFIASSLRFIPAKIPTLEQLHLPPILKIFTRIGQGFVLVVGPNGHGKSTTMASLVDSINHERNIKIITIEDPVEYILTSANGSIIDQRELGRDTFSFQRALRATFRQNVDVIMVGEMRDYETMSAAVTAAETGHLVFASLHTNNAAQTVDRIIDTFPSAQQPQIRVQLSNTLSGIVSQRLIPRIRGGLIPAAEVLIANSAVRNLIRENRLQQLNAVIETSYEEGMISMNRSLVELIKRGEISLEQAEFYSLNPRGLKDFL